MHRSEAPLKADIAYKFKMLNKKKVALDAKADTSASIEKLELLEKELKQLEERVRTTQKLIQDEKALIASSKQEA